MKKFIIIMVAIISSVYCNDVTDCGMYIKEVEERKLNGQYISELDDQIYKVGLVVMIADIPEADAEKFLKGCLKGRQFFLKRLGRITEESYHKAMADIERRY